MLHNTPGDQPTVKNYPVRSQRCRAVARLAPATGDSGAASGTWQNVPSRRSKSSASNRSMWRTSRRTPRSHQDRSPRTRDTPSKRKTDGPEFFSLDQAAREELLEFQGEYHEELLSNQMLGDRVRMLESEVVSRNRVVTLKSNSQPS